MTDEVERLNEEFSFHDGVNGLRFVQGEGDIPRVEIHNGQASAVISLQGAHVLSWSPFGADDVIWLSDDATFAPGKSVRGGIPVCWPWFGANETNESFPAHGFARTVYWQVKATQQLPDGATQIIFELDTSKVDEKYRHMWPMATVVEYRMTISKTLMLELTTYNRCEHSITVGQALHTYFKVDDVSNVCVFGLEDKEYLDKTLGFKRKTQSGLITIDREVDRVYLGTDDDIVIDDTKRKITISKQGSHSTVVWNPWKQVAEDMGDLGEDGYLKMLCVESANAAEDTVNIGAGEKHILQVTYAVESY